MSNAKRIFLTLTFCLAAGITICQDYSYNRNKFDKKVLFSVGLNAGISTGFGPTVRLGGKKLAVQLSFFSDEPNVYTFKFGKPFYGYVGSLVEYKFYHWNKGYFSIYSGNFFEINGFADPGRVDWDSGLGTMITFDLWKNRMSFKAGAGLLLQNEVWSAPMTIDLGLFYNFTGTGKKPVSNKLPLETGS